LSPHDAALDGGVLDTEPVQAGQCLPVTKWRLSFLCLVRTRVKVIGTEQWKWRLGTDNCQILLTKKREVNKAVLPGLGKL
jgi:hypothetical protein